MKESNKEQLNWRDWRDFFIVNILAPLLISLFLAYKIRNIDMLNSSTTVSAIIGYSFAALFFLMALPRQGFIQAIDESGFLILYGLIISLPSFTGIFNLFLCSLDSYSYFYRVTFFITIIDFFMTMSYIFLILKKYRKSV